MNNFRLVVFQRREEGRKCVGWQFKHPVCQECFSNLHTFESYILALNLVFQKYVKWSRFITFMVDVIEHWFWHSLGCEGILATSAGGRVSWRWLRGQSGLFRSLGLTGAMRAMRMSGPRQTFVEATAGLCCSQLGHSAWREVVAAKVCGSWLLFSRFHLYCLFKWENGSRMKQIQKKHNERKTLTEEGEDDLLVGVRCNKGRLLILKQTTEGKKNGQICRDDKQRLKTGLSVMSGAKICSIMYLHVSQSHIKVCKTHTWNCISDQKKQKMTKPCDVHRTTRTTGNCQTLPGC